MRDIARDVRSTAKLVSVVAALLLPAAFAHAAPVTFFANLTGSNEVPPVNSPGSGTATVILDTVAQTIEINASFTGLTSNTTAAHIHCCQPLGTNAGVATVPPAFPNFPLGVTSGNYSQGFSLNDAGFYNPAFITAQGGLAQAVAFFVAGLQNGQSYFNIHTVNNGGGEIRGQLFATPLPAAVLLFGSALLGFGLMRFRRAPT